LFELRVDEQIPGSQHAANRVSITNFPDCSVVEDTTCLRRSGPVIPVVCAGMPVEYSPFD